MAELIFHRFSEQGLAHFSYVVADEESREAVVIDPRRDVDVYTDWLEDESLRLTGVLETHIHADYASGAEELATLARVPLYASRHDEGERYELTVDHVPVGENDRINVGDLSFVPLHTPGHTPEHISFLLHDSNRDSDQPVKLFSGDFLFVQSLGRPDLIGEESKRDLARKLFESVQKIKQLNLPEELDIHPAHGAGSLCGAGMSQEPESTLRKEAQNNPYFQYDQPDEFIDAVLGALGRFPSYYGRMKELNTRGAPHLQPISAPEALDLQDVQEGYGNNPASVLVDVREPEQFGEVHIPGALNLPLSPNINRFGPWVIPYDQPIYLVGDVSTEEQAMEQVYRQLVRVGLDDVVGYLEGGITAWEFEQRPSMGVIQHDPDSLQYELRENPDLWVLDVRMEGEFESGHVPGAHRIMLGDLRERTDELPDNWKTPIVTICSSGYRSTLAASILEQLGYENIGHLAGGFTGWAESDYDVEGGVPKPKSEAAKST